MTWDENDWIDPAVVKRIMRQNSRKLRFVQCAGFIGAGTSIVAALLGFTVSALVIAGMSLITLLGSMYKITFRQMK